jgi:hypothetical protein
MSGFVGQGRLQDGEWLMRACMLMNRDLPAGAPEYTAETELNRVYTQQVAEFDELLSKIDPEHEINHDIFPVLAHFSSSEGWPLDIILAAFAWLCVWLFMPNYYGIFEYVAYMAISAFVAIQYLRSRRVRERAKYEMRMMGLDPSAHHPLTLRMLVKYRKESITRH